MAVNLTTSAAFGVKLRTFSGFTAALSAGTAAFLFLHGRREGLQLSVMCAGALVWGSFAVFGNKPGWSRTMTIAALVVYLALSAWLVAVHVV